MTAHEFATAKFEAGSPVVCRRCGLLDDIRVEAGPDARLARAVCRCGAPVVVFESPEVLVPFGIEAGTPLADMSERSLRWLHGATAHPWVLAVCCDLLGCVPDCATSLTDYYAGVVPPSRAPARRPRRGRW